MGKADHRNHAQSRPVQHPSQRDAELEDWLNAQLYHPLSHRLALALSRTRITPNMVSALGAMSIICAAAIYWHFDSLYGAMFGLAVHMNWHVLDGADGDLARLTGRASPAGEIVDGLCDYAGHLVLYVVLASVLAEQIGPSGWVLVIGAGIARAFQTTFYETQRRRYLWWTKGKSWIGATINSTTERSAATGKIVGFYLRLGQTMSGEASLVEQALADRENPSAKTLISRIEANFLPVLQQSRVLSSNYRTLAIGIAMMAGSPIYFAIFELVILNLVFALMVWKSHRALRQVSAHLHSTSR